MLIDSARAVEMIMSSGGSSQCNQLREPNRHRSPPIAGGAKALGLRAEAAGERMLRGIRALSHPFRRPKRRAASGGSLIGAVETTMSGLLSDEQQ